MDTAFDEDLGADSVDLVELVMAMEEEFEVGEIRRMTWARSRPWATR